jgi:tRNA(Arg) A34 adenosine deaminase TadA
MATDEDQHFIQRAVELALRGMSNNEGGPFGALVVKDGKVIGEGNNRVTSANDPTAHAEIVAIREACRSLNTYQLEGCTIYTSCEPCPMCLGAIYWARPARIVYACNRKDAAAADFDDEFIYTEIATPISERSIPTHQCGRELALEVFRRWKTKTDKKLY